MDIWVKLCFTSLIVALASMLAIKVTPDDARDWVCGVEVTGAVCGAVGVVVFALIYIWMA